MRNSSVSALSGERFRVRYRIWGNEKEALQKAEDICIEQTIEFPHDLIPQSPVFEEIVGRIVDFRVAGEEEYIALISYAAECAAGEFLQALNVVFGNISLKPGIRVEEIHFSPSILIGLKGPRFGQSGIRDLLGVPRRPLLFTALKPMGLTTEALSELAYRVALGGIDVIKDDHGLTNQKSSPFEKRVEACASAVMRANSETGFHSIYVPNITASFRHMEYRAKFAKQAGAGAVLIAPGLTGIDAMRAIAEDDSIGLPVCSHPAFQGSYVVGQSGIDHAVLFGQMARYAGADATIFPNYGGRFSFSREQCLDIAKRAKEPTDGIKPIFVCPAGGMELHRIPDMIETYGRDVMLLMGGGLFRNGPDVEKNSRDFRELAEQYA